MNISMNRNAIVRPSSPHVTSRLLDGIKWLVFPLLNRSIVVCPQESVDLHYALPALAQELAYQ